MSNIDKRALREAAEKALPAMKRLLMMPNDELFDEALLNVDGDVDAANAFNLLTGPETVLALLDELEATYSRIGELEVIATDYGMKFQRAQDALKHQALIHKSQLEAAEKRIAEPSGQKRLIGWRASDYTDETSDPELAKNWAAAIGVLPIFEGDVNTKLSAAGIGKGE
ncbi:ead/Ea22-like family protein [Salmonella enterica]|uniref:ead/Ea22-like family protein n=1 Tax=Salmonella enterica TaxID=28901 RepID=UPI0013FE4D1E|nr:ead/Ea22-like family protein [Salmonella enterica]MBG8796431.1 ead/Ea22-like family protein [Salmonella enterica subsp. enterica]MBW5385069.1 ead/Ea22-like family protein [Salmonella enterica subsp. enterica serovar Minnesota]NHJ44730.1 ead/Ea22-like family protein [Salmonella enterica subsp. enterica]